MPLDIQQGGVLEHGEVVEQDLGVAGTSDDVLAPEVEGLDGLFVAGQLQEEHDARVVPVQVAHHQVVHLSVHVVLLVRCDPVAVLHFTRVLRDRVAVEQV